MPVFSVFFRILKKSLPSMAIYLTVFVGIAVLATTLYPDTSSAGFEDTRSNIAVINRDTDSALVGGLTACLAERNTLVDLPDDSQRLQDELFYRNVEYIAIIPAGFTADFEAGSPDRLTIQKVVVPDSTDARYVDLQLDNYLNATRRYLSFSALSASERADAVAANLSRETAVTVNAFNGKTVGNDSFSFLSYFGYLAYVLIALIFLGISTILIVFNQPDLRRRNLCSPISQRSLNLQLALGCIAFSVLCWLIAVGIGVLLYGQKLLDSGLAAFCLMNSFVLTIVCVSIGFLVGILIKSYNAQSAIANVLSLGMSFLCGVFVPQSIMSKEVLRFSSFLPVYWYVKANDAIGRLTDFSAAGLAPILTAMLIQLGFAVALFAVALLIGRQKRTGAQNL